LKTGHWLNSVQDEQNLTADIPNINSKVIKHRTDGQHARIAARLCAGRAAQVYERYQCGARASEPAVGALLTLAAVLNPVPEGMAPGPRMLHALLQTQGLYMQTIAQPMLLSGSRCAHPLSSTMVLASRSSTCSRGAPAVAAKHSAYHQVHLAYLLSKGAQVRQA